jgi:hypothetical protein
MDKQNEQKRKLKVSYLGEKPCIRIVADYLYKFGFEIGDRLDMSISTDTIIIKKCHDIDTLNAE